MAPAEERPPSWRFWLLTGVVYALICFVLAALSLDVYNLNGDILSVGYLWLGLNPYHTTAPIGEGYAILPGAGYIILPYNAVAYLGFSATGFSLTGASVLLRSVDILGGFLAARVIYRLTLQNGHPLSRARTLYLAILFNPFLIFVTSVTGESDVIVVMLLFLALYLFHDAWNGPISWPAVVLGTVAVCLTVFSYYLTALLIPTYIAALPDWRRRLSSAGVFVHLLLVFAIPLVVYQLATLGLPSLIGTSAGDGYTFPYYVPASLRNQLESAQGVFTALIIGVAAVLPFGFRRLRANPGVSMLAVLFIAFSLTFFIPADPFVILAALVPLSFALTQNPRPVRFSTILAFQLFLLPMFLLIEMFNGPGQTSGVFYWFYPTLHQNITLLNPLGGYQAARALFALYVVGAVVTIWALLRIDRRSSAAPGTQPDLRPRSRGRPPTVRPWDAVLVVAVAGVIIGASSALAYLDPNRPTVEYTGQFNSQFFYTYDVESQFNFPLAGPNTFSVNGLAGTVSFVSQSPPIGFARDTVAQSTLLRFNVSADESVARGPFPVWKTSSTELLFSSQLSLPAGSQPVTPLSTDGSVSAAQVNPVISGNTSVFEMAGIHAVEYGIPAGAWVITRQFFGGEFYGNASGKNLLWSLYLPGLGAQAFVDRSTFYLGVKSGSTWSVARATATIPENEWFLSSFSVDPVQRTISASLYNAKITLPFPIGSGENGTLYLGKYDFSPGYDFAQAWVGNLTALYSLDHSAVAFSPVIFLSSGVRTDLTEVGDGSSATVSYSGSSSGGTFSVDHTNVSLGSSDPYVLFGKLGSSPASVVFHFSKLRFSAQSGDVNVFWVVLGFAVLLPAWLIAWSGWKFWKARAGRNRT